MRKLSPRCLTASADLFAILKSTEKLERAYVRDAISAKEYEPLCSKLIGQYKTLYESLRDQVSVNSSCPRCIYPSQKPEHAGLHTCRLHDFLGSNLSFLRWPSSVLTVFSGHFLHLCCQESNK